MTTLAIAGTVALAIGLLIWALSRNARKRGESEAKVKQSKEVLDNVSKAQEAEHELSDPDKRDSVRSRFTRK